MVNIIIQTITIILRCEIYPGAHAAISKSHTRILISVLITVILDLAIAAISYRAESIPQCKRVQIEK